MAEDAALERFRELLRIRTVAGPDLAEHESFVTAVERLYPAIHAELQRELVDGHTILYRWPGRTAGSPAVLMAHYDVVPADADGWEHPPFAAEVTGDGAERVVWARGTLDDKGALVAILEAVTDALTDGVQPERDVWLCFGHDEETLGTGAQRAAELLGGRGVRASLVLDEGGAVVEGVFPGVDRPLAVIGIAEKGIATITLTVAQQGGHAFAPPELAATARLARAIGRLSRRPFRPRLTEPVRELIRRLGPVARGPVGLALRTIGRIGPLTAALLGRAGPETRALTRTTAVVTTIEAGHAHNALPERAVATVNVRILPGETRDTVLAHIRRAVADDQVQVELVAGDDPSVVSPAAGPAWELLERTVAAVYPDALTTPYLMLGATDARHFTAISDHVYRFSPFEMSGAERSGLHGMNERIRVATFLQGIRFYRALIDGL